MYPHNHVTTFANRNVEEFDSDKGITDSVGRAIALRCDYDSHEKIADKLQKLLQDSQASKLEALVIGAWESLLDGGNDSSKVINALVAAKEQLKGLKAIFIGDILSDEYEISWIEQCNITPLLEAYPNLEVLRVRGATGLGFTPIQHNRLKTLIVESGGLSGTQIAQIVALELPALEHLELWLGDENYGGDSSVDDLMPILHRNFYPKLTYLGLRNATYTDDIAEAVVNSPILSQIKTLDLSMGTMGEKGVEALISCDTINQLDVLDVSENFLEEEAIARQKRLNIQVIADNQKEEEDEEDYGYSRYCSVSE
ncbi:MULTISPECIES: STM4015 family protein [unclassified Coleofasciculus]|uniref:STM4015 family protein n=1 Tax=unclassified Coleofasciculus TaxID=2692782 RepID=UPI001882101E|nr:MULTISPECIES: STM4015 family protein [unclassified Coleofasciculus]MBE9128461.1 STM4015 family protein [Coleofasciculus sp. LEGE 07081]MBE9149280.1 STM4015 family protein [Coleofasciculus sp. LEGE 07092]